MKHTKQSAVDWAIEKLEQQYLTVGYLSAEFVKRTRTEAKRKFRAQIVDAWELSSPESKRVEGEEYYEETYGK